MGFIMCTLLWLVAIASVCTIIGRAVYEFCMEFYAIYIAKYLDKSADLKRYGSWALVTGASDGIGKGYAFALAAKGLHVVLVSRSEEKLKKVQAEIAAKYPDVQTRIIVHDYSKRDDVKDTAKFSKELEGINNSLGIIVNNVGGGGPSSSWGKSFQCLGQEALEQCNDMIRLNVESLTFMSSFFVPRLTQRRKGIFINIASVAAIAPIGRHVIYAATKAFVDFFSRGLRCDLLGTGVEVQTVYPSFVKTNILPGGMHDKLPSLVAPSYMSFASSAVATIGFVPETYGCLSHRLQGYIWIFLFKVFPHYVTDGLAKGFGRRMAAFAEEKSSKKKN